MIQLNEADKQWAEDFFARLEKKLSRSAVELADILPGGINEEGKYVNVKNPCWWTNGFFGGTMWLLYKETGKEIYRKAAEKQELLLDAALEKYDGLHHDVGFMWGLTAKASYRITENPKSRLRAIYAANILAARYNIKGNYISAWNGDKKTYSIIDCMMNVPLLYWAADELDRKSFRFIAEAHADMTMREHIREDGSAVHIAVHNDEKDAVLETLAGQGYAVGSAWSRGQAWAVYGFVLSFLHTGQDRFLQTARRAADYFLAKAKETDYRVRTDFCAPAEPVYYDTSAAVCAACGVLEIYKATGEQKYLDGALALIKAVEQDCDFTENNQSILQNGMESYRSGRQTHLIYADFFLCEALLKLRNSAFLIW